VERGGEGDHPLERLVEFVRPSLGLRPQSVLPGDGGLVCEALHDREEVLCRLLDAVGPAKRENPHRPGRVGDRDPYRRDDAKLPPEFEGGSFREDRANVPDERWPVLRQCLLDVGEVRQRQRQSRFDVRRRRSQSEHLHGVALDGVETGPVGSESLHRGLADGSGSLIEVIALVELGAELQDPLHLLLGRQRATKRQLESGLPSGDLPAEVGHDQAGGQRSHTPDDRRSDRVGSSCRGAEISQERERDDHGHKGGGQAQQSATDARSRHGEKDDTRPYRVEGVDRRVEPVD